MKFTKAELKFLIGLVVDSIERLENRETEEGMGWGEPHSADLRERRNALDRLLGAASVSSLPEKGRQENESRVKEIAAWRARHRTLICCDEARPGPFCVCRVHSHCDHHGEAHHGTHD